MSKDRIENLDTIKLYNVKQIIGLKFRVARALMKNIYPNHKHIGNFSQTEVAKHLGITYSDVANLEKGSGLLPKSYALINMYRDLGIELTFFFDSISDNDNQIIQVLFSPKEGFCEEASNHIITVKYEPANNISDVPVPPVSYFLTTLKFINN